MNLGKSWSEMSAQERAIFTSHLMYEPDRHLLIPESEVLNINDWRAAFQNLHDLSVWCDEAEAWIEREAIRHADQKAFKNRSVWGRKP